jgi:5'-nucleotidase
MDATRRNFLAAIGALGLAGLSSGNGSRLVLLHTNDIHGHLTAWRGWEGDLQDRQIGGLDRLAAAVLQIRQDNDGQSLLLDAGDCWGDTMIADQTKGSALVAALNHLAYDAMTVGNHEPDFGREGMKSLIAQARFPVVAANLVVGRDGPLFSEAYVVRDVGGVRVGILGLAYPKTPWTTSSKNLDDLDFQKPEDVARRFIPRMRDEGAGLIVLLTHLGLSADKQLAEAVSDIDVIVGGHSHNRMGDALRVGKTLIVQAGAHGSDLGRLDLVLEKGRITDHRRTLIPLDHERIPADPGTERLIRELLEPHQQALQEPVGVAGDWLVRAQTLAGQEARKRDQESPVDSMFADIVREATRADVALLPGVGYGVAIPPGPITAAQLRQLVPHDGKVFTMQLAGAQLRDILEQSVENTFSDDAATKVGGMIQVAGIRFHFDPSRTHGQRVLEIAASSGDWDLGRKYLVATNSLLAQGGHNYREFLHAENVKQEQTQYDMIKHWIREHSPVTTPPPGRIRRVG